MATSPAPPEKGDHHDSAPDHHSIQLAQDDERSRFPVKDGPVSPTALFRYADRTDKLLMLSGSLGAIVAGLGQPLLAFIYGKLIDDFTALATGALPRASFRAHIQPLVLAFVGLGCASLVGGAVMSWAWGIAGARQTRRVRQLAFRALLRQDIRFFERESGGTLTARLAGGAAAFQDGVSEKPGQVLMHLTTLVGGFAVAYAREWRLALVLSVFLPLLAITGAITGKVIATALSSAQRAYASANGIADEILSNVKTVFAFNAQAREAARFRASVEHASAGGLRKAIVSGTGIGCMVACIYALYAVGFRYGATLVVHGKTSVGAVFNVLMAVLLGSLALGSVAPLMTAFGAARAAAGQLYATIDAGSALDTLTPVSEAPVVEKAKAILGCVEFRDVHFAYPARPDISVLKGMSFIAQPGQTVALVGPSGSGKSTVAQLVERFYEPTVGSITLDDTPLDSYNIQSIRAAIGFVQQEAVLFDMTIADNIRMGLEAAAFLEGRFAGADVPMEQVVEAAKVANAHDFISRLPEGYETRVGQRGAQLSGGQKQRICIARAVIRDPRVLLLDEATAALDNQSERVVTEALNRASEGRTTVVVAHRLSTIRHADLILVMDGGVVVQRGTHDELMAAGGMYRKMALAQELHRGADAPTRATDTATKDQHEVSSDESSTSPEVNLKELAPNPSAPDGPVAVSSGVHSRYTLLLQGRRWQLALGMIGSIGAGAVNPLFAWCLGQTLNVFTGNPRDIISQSELWSGIFGGLAIFTLIVNFFHVCFLSLSSDECASLLRSISFEALLRQEYAFFDRQENSVGALTSSLATNPTSAAQLSTTVSWWLQIATVLAGCLGLALGTGWKLALVVSSMLPVLIGAAIFQMRSGSRKQADLDLPAATAQEAIAGIRTVMALGLQARAARAYEDALEAPYRADRRQALIVGVGYGLSLSVMFYTYALAYWYGGGLVASGEYTFRQMVTIFSSVVFAATSTGRGMALAPDHEKSIRAIDSILNVVNRVPEMDARSGCGVDAASVEGAVSFKDVSFRYRTRKDVLALRDFNLRVKPGMTVGLVGSSGSGKSTVVSLLLRLYDAERGSVNVDGSPLPEYDLPSLRQCTGIVIQEPALFSFSVRQNISYGRPEATPLEIEDAARQANIHDFISSLPEGYDTVVGERGSMMSGGQRQRIAIARSLLLDPKILLLDEATSALDQTSEEAVQASLAVASKGRTTFVVAHRLATVQHADLIVVVDKGAVVEQGTHLELAARPGLYSSLLTGSGT